MNYMSVKEAAAQWQLSISRVRALCAAGQIPGVLKPGKGYLIPASALKPADGRRLRGRHINPLYAQMFAQIDSMLQELVNRRPMRLHQFIRWQEADAIDFIYHNAALDGNQISRQETRMVISGSSMAGKSLRDHLEILFHREAVSFLKEALYAKVDLSAALAEEIQAILVWEQPGIAKIYRENTQADFADLIAQFNDSRRHPLEEAAEFHLRMLALQPFQQANNLTARILLNFMLIRKHYPPIIIKTGDKSKYKTALETYVSQGTEFLMVELIGQKVSAQLAQHLEQEPENEQSADVSQMTLWDL